MYQKNIDYSECYKMMNRSLKHCALVVLYIDAVLNKLHCSCKKISDSKSKYIFLIFFFYIVEGVQK